MTINNTYRSIAATFFIVAITQVFVLQSVHHVCEHHDEEIACESEGAHFHSIEQSHLSCDICFFQLSPSESTDADLSIIKPNKYFISATFSTNENIAVVASNQQYLRGPPASLYIS